MPIPLRVLIVEDCVDDTFFVVRELQRAGYQVDFERVETAAAMREALQSRPWDLVISDYRMPQFDGSAALALFKQFAIEIPFIIVSGAIGEDLAVAIVKAGAHDYIKKDNLSQLGASVRCELESSRERRSRNQTEAATAYLANLVRSCDTAIIGQTLDGTVLSWNIGAERIHGYTAAEMIGRSIATLVPEDRQHELAHILNEVRRGSHIAELETTRLRKDGSRIEVSLNVSPVRDADGRVIGASLVAHDVTSPSGGALQPATPTQQLSHALSKTP